MNENKDKIKILSVNPGLNICGGIESYTMNYYRNFSDNIRVDFATHDIKKNNYVKEIKSRNDNIFLFEHIGLKTSFKFIKQLKQFFKEHHDYDIIHCNMANASPFYFYYAKKYNIKVRIIHSHQNKYADKFINKERNIQLIYLAKKLATHNFACSRIAWDFLFKNKKYYTVKNAIDVEKFKFNQEIRDIYRKKLNISDNELLIGHVGRFSPSKNHSFLIEIAKELIDKNNKIKLILVGIGDLRKDIEVKVKALGIESNVYFTGLREDIPNILNNSNLFILPSIYEGLGLVLLEAQASNLPCLVSEAIQPEVDLGVGLVKRLNLSVGAKVWAKESEDLINNKGINKDIYIANAVKEKAYDLSSILNNLLSVYKLNLE